MRNAVIEFTDFSFKYKAQAKPTLHNINLTIYEGEKVLIIGPSGSGKSTLTHCLNGLIPFSYEGDITGSLKIMNKETKELSIFELSKYCGTVLQDPDSQFIGLTVAEDIAFKLENICVNQKDMINSVENASKLVDINDYLNSSPQQLSGGQKQRVTLAGVMVDDVDILLFDEPLANLDPHTGKVAIELIDGIKKATNKTMVIIEHRLEDVLYKYVDRIILINEGKILADMSPSEILSSDLLINNGIREPLYITALKYCNCKIVPEMKPENISTIDLSNCKENINLWYNKTKDSKAINEGDTILEFKNINFSYNKGKQILHDISFKIQRGSIVSIVGRNGAGKSTISKLICGFYKPDSGQILLNNADIEKNTIKERSQHIGMVMQNPNQMISKAMIFDEVAMGLRARNIDEGEIKERVFQTLKICGLYEFRNWPISALSFGQKKRVTIASILVLNPEIIILDEPTAGQDFKHYNEIMEFLLTLNELGVTIIMITHDMHLMLEYTNQAIVLSEGKKLAHAPAAHILTDEKVIAAANLKETSLFELAVKAGIQNPRDFVKKFIDYDREVRRI